MNAERRRGGDKRVAVVGAGIAGCAAAWALDLAGFEVELFEAAPVLGGNAKTHDWLASFAGDEQRVTTMGLSVLAWPRELFRNYRRLLEVLEVETEPVELRLFVRSGTETFVHGEGLLAARYADDLRRWRRLVRFVSAINALCSGFPRTPSLYHFGPLNPLNLTPLWPLARRFGISRGFWEDIFVPVHSATFLTTELDRLPAVIVPTIDELMPLTRPAKFETWRANSRVVFERLTASFAERVHTGCAITGIEPGSRGSGVELRDCHGVQRRFDVVVLACSAGAVDRALVRRRWLHDRVLPKIRYADEHDETFVEGVVHDDPTLIPAADRNRVLAEHCNYVEVTRTADGRPRYANHFVLSSWVPAARGTKTAMLVSYNAAAAPDPLHMLGLVDNRGAHPAPTLGNLSRALALRWLQGKDGLYYCGSYATPGNGHDLSLLSGLVVAEQIGAPYPFAADPEARADFERLRRLMIGWI
jgi:uncharacterized protein